MRKAQVAVTPELVARLFSGRFEITAHALPSDARKIGAGYDPGRDEFWVLFTSEEFDEVPDGGTVPFLPPPVVTRLED